MFRVIAVALAMLFVLPVATATAQEDDPRYGLAGGCYTVDGGGPYRMQATALGRYLLYAPDRTFLTAGPGGEATLEPAPSEDANWTVTSAAAGSFEFRLGDGRGLSGASAVGEAKPLAVVAADGCPGYPEVEVNATGEPSKGATPFGEVRGFVDAHMHMMAFEFLGGMAHCGRPWHPYGAPYALTDCPDHYPNGQGAVLENVYSFSDPTHTHDPQGWPTFKDWPAPHSLTHEQSYYKWVERAWRGGQRIFVNLLVENKVLCQVYPYKRNSCDEMDSVRLQAKRIRELEDYIDAQHGGPGKGWFRIVTNPFEAREVINDGKLAVVLGIEVSEPFGCQLLNKVPQCTAEDIDRQLDEVYDLGVRDMELINKFDNALGGVAGDSGTTGLIVNQGNLLTTGRYWDMRPCSGPTSDTDHDRDQVSTLPAHNDDDLIANGLAALVPTGSVPLYQPGPHCNAYGLSSLGEHTVRRMMAKKMIIDPDHLSVLARDQVLSILEAARWPGVVSSHSWSTPGTYPRVYALGGVVTPYAGDSTSFVEAWQTVRAGRSFKHYFGFGFGADMNGLGPQGDPRLDADNPVRYPFKSFDGAVTLDRQRSGERVFDINTDGVAHYGLYPDWIEDLRMLAGDAIVEDLARGAEAYLQMWERTEGVPARACLPRHGRFTRRGLGRVSLRLGTEPLLRAAGQPGVRAGRTWRYCVRGGGRVTAVLAPDGTSALVRSTAKRHRLAGWRPGARHRGLLRGTIVRPSGERTWNVVGVRRGRVRFVAVADRGAVTRRAVKRYLSRAR